MGAESSTYVYIANASFAATSGRGIVIPFSFYFFSLIGHQVILARERMSQDNVAVVSFSVYIPSWVDHFAGQSRGCTLDGNQKLQS